VRSDKYDRFVWVLLGLVVVGLCAFATGCTTQDEFRATAASLEVTYGVGDGSLERGAKDLDTDSSWWAFGVRPFAYWDMKMRAQMNARAILEQRYAERPPPPAEPQAPCEPKPK